MYTLYTLTGSRAGPGRWVACQAIGRGGPLDRGTPDSLRAKPDGASVGELPNTTIEQMTLRLRIVLGEVFETG